MSYKYPCFISHSTKELTERLYRFGGREGKGFWHSTNSTLLIAESTQYRCLDDEWGNKETLKKKGYIDCGDNEELFLAIASIEEHRAVGRWYRYREYLCRCYQRTSDFFKCKTVGPDGFPLYVALCPSKAQEVPIKDIVEFFTENNVSLKGFMNI